MAYVLSLAPSSPFPGMCSGDARHSSSCSLSTNGTVLRPKIRNLSNGSVSSLGSFLSPKLACRDGSGSPRPTTPSNLSVTSSLPRRASPFPRPASLTSLANSRSRGRSSDARSRLGKPEERVEMLAEEDTVLPQSGRSSHDTFHSIVADDDISPAPASPKPKAFRRWVSTLRRKKFSKPRLATPREDRWQLDDFDPRPPSPSRYPRHGKSSSYGSSMHFVTAVKSATATLASATASKCNSQWRRGQQTSSVMSGSEPRASTDTQRSMLDEGAKNRARKRRRKLEELIRSEESYVADLKALSNAYFTLLGNETTTASFTRATAQKTIAELLHLHDDILGQLHAVVPFAKYDQSVAKMPEPAFLKSHARWHSIDAVPTRSTPPVSKLTTIRQGRRSLSICRSSDEEYAALKCSPQVAADVAQLFSQNMNRLSAYEDFGAHYDLIQRDIQEAQRGILDWSEFDKAIETISSTINPVRSREANRKKASTVKDLLIKPIQRLPRYELLFSDLCKLVPVCDGPMASTVLEKTLEELKQSCHRMNQAKENPLKSRMLQTTWLIGDRLSFSSQVPRAIYLQLLGSVLLCGCLHIAYRGRGRVKGSYVVCVLFESTLLLADADEEQPKYTVLAGVALANATIQETDNGKGLQCHTAPHSWKLVFEHSARMYEFIVTACTAVEAAVWREQTGRGIEDQSQAVADGTTNVFELHSPLTNEMKSVGRAFGKPGSFVRRMSVHRTATVGCTTDLNQVVIKNTQAYKEVTESSSSSSLQMPRSQSMVTPSHLQTLAPRRAERAHLEALLVDVWSKEALPYPGMSRRGDPIRASANHVMRKFSMASITSNFSSNFSSSKRSASYTSINPTRKEDHVPSKKLTKNYSYEARRKNRDPLVDFHNAPEAFLPADFELQDPAAKRKKSALRTLTMTMERPFSPLLGNSEKQSGLRRAQSTKDVIGGRTGMADTPVESEMSKQDGRETPGLSLRSVKEEKKSPQKGKGRNKLLRLFGER